MKMPLDKDREFNMETHIAFVDLKKAFHRCNRIKLLEILQNYNIQNIYNLYKTNWIAVKIEDRNRDGKQ
jgi:hypothetical protein